MNNIIFSKDYTMPFKRKFTKRRTTRKPTMKKVEKQIHKIQADLKSSLNYNLDTGHVSIYPVQSKLASDTVGWIYNTNWTISPLTNLLVTPPGVNASQFGTREGVKVTFDQIDLKYQITVSPSTWSSANNSTTPPYVRVMMLQIKQFPQSAGFGINAFTFNDIFFVPDTSLVAPFLTEMDAFARINPLQKANIIKLYDKIHPISANGAYQNNVQNLHGHKVIKKRIVCTYNDGTKTGVTSFNRNHVFLIALYGGLNASVATTLPGMIYNCMQTYHE